MIRTRATALLIAIAMPTLDAAQAPAPPGAPHKPPIRPRAAPNVVIPRPHVVPGPSRVVGAPAVVARPQFTYRGRMINRVRLAPFVYPPGWAYRRWVVGGILPPVFLAPAYYYADWATLGLDPPQPGFQWVRYGPDLLLVNVTTGAVVDVVYGVFS
jgi:Nickel/cobalt transporter regulator